MLFMFPLAEFINRSLTNTAEIYDFFHKMRTYNLISSLFNAIITTLFIVFILYGLFIVTNNIY